MAGNEQASSKKKSEFLFEVMSVSRCRKIYFEDI